MRLLIIKKYCIRLIFFSISIFFNFASRAGIPLHDSPTLLWNEREVKIKLAYNVIISGHLNVLELKMMVPANITNRQTIKSLSFSIQPDSIYQKNENTYALFRFHDIDKSFKIIMKTDILIFKSIAANTDSLPKDFSPYLHAENNIESDSPRIMALAAELKQKTDIATVMKTFEYVQNHIKYEANNAIGAEKVLEIGIGKCMDFSDLFVALLRANQIPAKSVFGLVVDYDGDNPLHAWPEAYLKKQGWIRFDPTTGHSEISESGKNYVMKISNKYIVLSEGRNDPEMHTSQYSYRYQSAPGSKVNIKLAFDVAALDTEN